MSNETKTTSLIDLSAVLSQEAALYSPVRANLMDYVWKQETQPGQISQKFPYLRQAAAAVATGEAAAIGFSEVLTSGVTLTPAKNATWATRIDDLARFTSNISDNMIVANQAVQSHVKKFNADITALYGGFTSTISGTDYEALMRQAVATLEANLAPRPYYFPVSPAMLQNFWKIYSTNTNFTAFANRDEVLLMGGMPLMYGIQPLLVNYGFTPSVSGATSGYTTTALYSREAIGAAVAYLYKPYFQEMAIYGSTDIAVISSYAVGTINPDWGISVIVKNGE